MVFSTFLSPIEEEAMTSEVDEELYSGLRTQDLQEAKDQLLVETADMLHTPLFTAEALLRDNEWSREVGRLDYLFLASQAYFYSPCWISGCRTL